MGEMFVNGVFKEIDGQSTTKRMKKIYLIGGTMGVGKTAVCMLLKQKLPYSVFLDGDWCWDSVPFQVTEETKRMVIDNICYLLNNFIHCSAYRNIIFCWVMHHQSIVDAILSRLDTKECEVKTISLHCNAESLSKRLQKDISLGIRQPDILPKSIDRIPLYSKLYTIKIDTSNISIEEVVQKILTL